MYIKAGTYQTESVNGENKYIINIDENWTSESFDYVGVSSLSIRVFSTDADGEGTLTLQYSVNNIDFETLKDSLGADIVWTIDGTDVDGYDAILPFQGWYRFNYVNTDNSEGNLYISVVR